MSALMSWIEEAADLLVVARRSGRRPSGVDALARLLEASARFEPQIHRIGAGQRRGIAVTDPVVAALGLLDRVRPTSSPVCAMWLRDVDSDGRLAPGWDGGDGDRLRVGADGSTSAFELLVRQRGCVAGDSGRALPLSHCSATRSFQTAGTPASARSVTRGHVRIGRRWLRPGTRMARVLVERRSDGPAPATTGPIRGGHIRQSTRQQPQGAAAVEPQKGEVTPWRA